MAFLLSIRVARAEPSPASTETGSAETADPQGQAEALLEQAKELFRKGQYREALPLIESAHELTQAPRF